MKSKLYHRILAVVLTTAITMTAFPVAAVAEMADDVSASMSSSQMSDAPNEAAPSAEESNASENVDAFSQQSEVFADEQSESAAEGAQQDPSPFLTEDASTERVAPGVAQAPPAQVQSKTTKTTEKAISSAQDMQDINNDLSGSYYLTKDIDLTGVGFMSIGSKDAPFTGTFDGNGYKMIIQLNRIEVDCQGLFGYVQNGTIKDVEVTGFVNGDNCVGGIVGYMDGGSIRNCSSDTKVTANGNYVGGIVGYIQGNVIGCYNTGNIIGDGYIGGVVGFMSGAGNIEYCSNSATLTGDNYVGGVAGIMSGAGNIEYCHNTGTLSNSAQVIGGVIGYAKGNINGCYNTGLISGSYSDGSRNGGVAGAVDGKLTNCYNTAKISGNDVVGGVVGIVNRTASLENCYNTGFIFTPKANAGGVAGSVYGDVKNCYNMGKVLSYSYYNTGGVAGYIAGNLINCYNTGTVIGNGDYVGGLAGSVEGSVNNCYNTGPVSSSESHAIVGGVAGFVRGGMSNCYSIGLVCSSSHFVGYLAGVASGDVSNCYYGEEAGDFAEAFANGVTGEHIEDLSIEQMTGGDALEYMTFTDTSAWTALSANGADYFPQLCTFVQDSENPQPEEMVLPAPADTIDLADGSITIICEYGVNKVVQNGETICPVSNTIEVITSRPCSNTITVDSSLNNHLRVILKDVNISTPESAIKLSDGADVVFALKGTNNVTGLSYKEETDYPAIEVPSSAEVTFSGDGTLNATARGYGAAIGTEGYYRDREEHSDNSKSSGVVNIKGSVHVVATSVYGAGIGGGAINGTVCIQSSFDNGEVYISEDAIVEATCTKGYSAGIGGGGCYTATCEAYGGDGGIIEISGNAQVTAKCTGFLGTGIGGGGACAETCNCFPGDGERFVSKDNAVVNAYGADYAPGIGGGGSQQKTCRTTFPGDGGDVILQGNTVVTADGGKNAQGVDAGHHCGGYTNMAGSDPVIQREASATLNNL